MVEQFSQPGQISCRHHPHPRRNDSDTVPDKLSFDRSWEDDLTVEIAKQIKLANYSQIEDG